MKNYSMGKTTNERFARKAQNSFSEEGTTYGETEFETDSLIGGSSSRNSVVDENE